VKVRPGDYSTTGQSITAVDNSGNTTAPHLHRFFSGSHRCRGP
jgi:murein DD-endopeptidase MepM/ murein hydrolase activator NlpD